MKSKLRYLTTFPIRGFDDIPVPIQIDLKLVFRWKSMGFYFRRLNLGTHARMRLVEGIMVILNVRRFEAVSHRAGTVSIGIGPVGAWVRVEVIIPGDANERSVYIFPVFISSWQLAYETIAYRVLIYAAPLMSGYDIV
ncbi:hypothetical protein GCM10008997_15830 [Halomonas salifodinae]